MSYEFVLNTLNSWAPVISAFAGILIMVVAFFTIRHSNRQYRRLKDERLIDKLIEWASECAEYAIALNKGRVVEKEANRPRYLDNPDFASPFVSEQVKEDRVTDIQGLRAKSAYMRNLVPSTASQLDALVKNLTDSLIHKLEFIHDPEGTNKWEKQLLTQAASAYELNKKIYASAIKVSEQASKYITNNT